MTCTTTHNETGPTNPRPDRPRAVRYALLGASALLLACGTSPNTHEDSVAAARAALGSAGAAAPSGAACGPRGGSSGARALKGFDGRRPVPARMVVLGDSIASCFGSDANEPCAPELVAQHLRATYVPDLEYASYAVPGTRTEHALLQAMEVPEGEGHVLVWIFMGGNDLNGCGNPDADAAAACVEALTVDLPVLWEEVFAHFNDPARFPDGVTYLFNTQYSLFDQCNHPIFGPERIPLTESWIRMFNEDIAIRLAEERADAIAIDHYPSWLGHGIYAEDATCPHYCPAHDTWLIDGTHPNARGHREIAERAEHALHRMYRGHRAKRPGRPGCRRD